MEMVSPTFIDVMAQFAKKIWSGPLPAPTVLRFPPNSFSDEGLDERIERNAGYFTVTLNEVFLSAPRRLWTTHDPLVYTAVEFIYGTERKVIPCFLGPRTIATNQIQVPRGFVIQDVDVLGPYPFRGGRVGLTVILYRAKKDDYAAKILKFAETLSSAVGMPPNMSLVEKVGASLLSSVETLLDMGDMVPIAGHRFDIDTATIKGFRTFSGALIADENACAVRLQVKNGRLMEAGEPFRAADFVLYTINGSSSREDERMLPFFPLLNQAIQEALTGDDAGWKRAKATLLTIYRQMLSCHDLIEQEVNTLFEGYINQVESAKKRSKQIGMMSSDKSRLSTSQIVKLDDVTNRVENL